MITTTLRLLENSVWIWTSSWTQTDPQQTQLTRRWINVGLPLGSVVDAGATLNQHWFNVLCLLGHVNPYSAGIDFSRQIDVRLWRLKSTPALQEYKYL